MKNKNEVRLNNIIFPFWMLLIIPGLWLIILPANFVIDSLVILITMSIIGIEGKGKIYRKTILKAWIFGFISDLIGTLTVFICSYIYGGGGFDDDPAVTMPGIIVAAIMIYVFNYFLTFKKYDKKLRFKLAISLAIFTAPYTFLIPTSWMI